MRKGDHHSQAARDNISNGMKAYLATLTPGQKHERYKNWSNTGKRWRVMTAEQRSEQYKSFYEAGAIANKARFAAMTQEERRAATNNWSVAGHMASSHRTSNTSSEQAFERMLIAAGKTKYEKQKRIGRYYVDFYFARTKAIVEVNGCYWHQCEQCGYSNGYGKRSTNQVRARNDRRQRYFESKGYRVIVVWEHDLHEQERIMK